MTKRFKFYRVSLGSQLCETRHVEVVFAIAAHSAYFRLLSLRLETAVLTKALTPSKSDRLGFLFTSGLKPGMVIAILVALLAVLYVSAALMMMRIDRLHTAYLNHPLVSPERFTQDRLLHYLNTNLDQIVKVSRPDRF